MCGSVPWRVVEELRRRLRRVVWIGGGSGAGKSVVARRLADNYVLRLHATDDVMADHAARANAPDTPQLAEFAAMDMDERWLHRSPATMLDTFHWFRGEAFDLIIEDLLALPDETGVVVEGFRLLPRLVQPLLTRPSQAVWLLPTADFRVAALERRGSLTTIADQTSDPERALQNLLTRDEMFTDRLRTEASQLGLRSITVDGTADEAELTRQVASALDLP